MTQYYSTKTSTPLFQERNSPSRVPIPFSGGSNSTSRERRDPSITPRKFRKFFTPRKTESVRVRSTRQAFVDVTRPHFCQKNVISSPVHSSKCHSYLDGSSFENLIPQTKRRKRFHTPDSPPTLNFTSYNSLRSHQWNSQNDIVLSSPCKRAAGLSDAEIEDENLIKSEFPSKTIIPLSYRGLAGQLLERSLGTSSRNGNPSHSYPVNCYQDHTGSFYSSSIDVHLNMDFGDPKRTIPFCAVACNTNSLVAIGDEDGYIRLLDSDPSSRASFQDIFLGFRVHKNAIIDMSFSNDDTRLVTASGDQSSRVVDMKTQTTISILSVHSASLKQARFQPGSSNNNVIATSSRDGSIQIWDLRCKGYEKPLVQIHTVHPSQDPQETRKVQYCAIVNSIYDAHSIISKIQASGGSDTPKRGESAGRLGDVSVTAIQFLPPDLSHYLLSASEANSSVKLWDIRNIRTSRRNLVPLSSTIQPQSHSKWRHFGISSMNLGSDSSRLYTLCKDSTVYVYSTTHLRLGQAPDTVRPVLNRSAQEALGPIYGFRHPQFHATSFYVKSALRKPAEGNFEMLAVGSGNGCAVIFPTDENYFSPGHLGDDLNVFGLPKNHLDYNNIPISSNGTALIRGHQREVGSLTWTYDGALITVGDDLIVRAWREGDEARELRLGGEQQGRRWGCGWADVDQDYDDDDDS